MSAPTLRELKDLIFEMRALGDDERLDVEDYVELILQKVDRAAEICRQLKDPEQDV